MEIKKFGGGTEVRLDISKLLKLEKELGVKYSARVGILGSVGRYERKIVALTKKGKRTVGKAPSSKTNAEIGLLHEKGSKSENIPRRSFLEVPLQTKVPKYMSSIGKKVMEGLTQANMFQAFKELALIGESIVLRAFNTSGYGQWAANTIKTIRRKKSTRPLIDSAQLRRSISSKVVKK